MAEFCLEETQAKIDDILITKAQVNILDLRCRNKQLDSKTMFNLLRDRSHVAKITYSDPLTICPCLRKQLSLFIQFQFVQL